MKKYPYWGALMLMLFAIGVLLITEGPVAPGKPIRVDWPISPSPAPSLALKSIRTMNETSFFKVIGTLHNRGTEPIGPIVVRGRFANRSDGTETTAMTLTMPEIIVPGGAALFELVTSEQPETARASIDFRRLTGEPIPVDGSHTTTEGLMRP